MEDDEIGATMQQRSKQSWSRDNRVAYARGVSEDGLEIRVAQLGWKSMAGCQWWCEGAEASESMDRTGAFGEAESSRTSRFVERDGTCLVRCRAPQMSTAMMR